MPGFQIVQTTALTVINVSDVGLIFYEMSYKTVSY